MNTADRMGNAAVVPVVVLDDAADAVPTAKALLAGGVDVMEITFRTAAAADSIEAVAKECPDMLVGAGTVITLEQCKNAVACGAKFIFNAANHAMDSLSTYTFPLFFEEWDLPTDTASIAETWDRRGDIVVGNDVWIGYEAIILAGVTIGDGAIIGSRAVVTKDVPPYTIVGGLPAKPIRKRFDEETIARLEALRWWDWDREKIKRSIDAIRHGDIDTLEKNA